MLQNTKTRPAECSRVEPVRIPVISENDILLARQSVRELASEAGLTTPESIFIVAAVSELAHNILQYAGQGEIMLSSLQEENRTGVMVVGRDNGPGISDLERALQDAFSTSGGLGLGLPGVRRMMDEFEIVSHQNAGTTVTVKKWSGRSTTGGRERTSKASLERRAGLAARSLAVADDGSGRGIARSAGSGTGS